jgi:Gram-negative bacterial TonB protein C-terminal
MNYFVRIVLLVLFCLTVKEGFSQNKTPKPQKKVTSLSRRVSDSPPKKAAEDEDFDKVFVHVPLEANTNPYEWEKHLRTHTTLPDSIVKDIPRGTYIVEILFVVNKDGKIAEAKTTKDPGYGLGKIAEKIIKDYKGEWQPAYQCGRAVNAYVRQPVKFVL